jgi:hypothetical protein
VSQVKESEILYKQLRNLQSRKSGKFKKWIKKEYPGKDMHHLLGSMTGIKLNDYLLLPLTRTEHMKAEKSKIEFAVDNLPKSLNILFDYIEYLESRK